MPRKDPEARREYDREYREKNKAVLQEKYIANRDKIKARKKRYCIKNCLKISKAAREYNLKSNYGITQEDYNILLFEQNNCCAICSTDQPSKNLRCKFFPIDHDHETGKIRGLLCDRCNRGLGLVGDSLENINNLLSYLKKSAYKELPKSKIPNNIEFSLVRRKEQLKYVFNITLEEYYGILLSQDNSCAVCKRNQPGANRKHFYVDHDHETGLIRGCLCHYCNTGLGMLGDNERAIQLVKKYLENVN